MGSPLAWVTTGTIPLTVRCPSVLKVRLVSPEFMVEQIAVLAKNVSKSEIMERNAPHCTDPECLEGLGSDRLSAWHTHS